MYHPHTSTFSLHGARAAVSAVCKVAYQCSLRKAFFAAVVVLSVVTLVQMFAKLQFPIEDRPAPALGGNKSQNKWNKETESMFHKLKAALRKEIPRVKTRVYDSSSQSNRSSENRLTNFNDTFNTNRKGSDGHEQNLQECPILADELGADKANISEMESKQWVPDTFDPAEALSLVQPGGIYRPTDCFQKQNTAVLIPNFHKDDAVQDLARYLHYFLQRQHKAYMLVFATQENGKKINRAAMINIAVMEISKRYPVDCIILHDIDSFPLNWRNDYSCTPGAVRQLLTSRDTENFKLKYKSYMGGVTAIWKEDFYSVNGMSNLYWGWGGEDDDLKKRVDKVRLKVKRADSQVGRYRHVHHGKRLLNPRRKKLQNKTRQRFRKDGLNSLKYELVSLDHLPLYTYLTARVLNNPKDAASQA